MNSVLYIDVHAPPKRVFVLAADIARWPELLPHYRKVTVLSRSGRQVTAQMMAVRRFGPLPVPVTWRAEQWPDDSRPNDLRLHFRHVRGATRGMEVTWRIRPHGEGSRISIEHSFRRPLPLLGPDLMPSVINRLFIRPIASLTLRTFKALAEGRA
jgi:ribosome-associated toxin RatA of RatAB toxin-antitoxin module